MLPKPDFILPKNIAILHFQIPSLSIFIALAFLLIVFVIWREGKKDGFDEERLFDLFIASNFFAFALSRIIFALVNKATLPQIFNHTIRFWENGMNVYGYALGILVAVYLFTRYMRWSLFRILDVYALAFSLGLAIMSLSVVAYQKEFVYLFVFAYFLVFFSVASYYRNVKVRSGVVFAIFTLGMVFLGLALGFSNNLIFYPILITLSLVTLYLRERKAFVKTLLPKEILTRLKGALFSKEQRIEREKKILSEEDPYMAAGRTEDNADLHDDVYEDIGHKEAEIKRTSLQRAQTQVRKALAKFSLGTYGYCELCGNPIESLRLEAYPEATLCLSCAKKQSK